MMTSTTDREQDWLNLIAMETSNSSTSNPISSTNTSTIKLELQLLTNRSHSYQRPSKSSQSQTDLVSTQASATEEARKQICTHLRGYKVRDFILRRKQCLNLETVRIRRANPDCLIHILLWSQVEGNIHVREALTWQVPICWVALWETLSESARN